MQYEGTYALLSPILGRPLLIFPIKSLIKWLGADFVWAISRALCEGPNLRSWGQKNNPYPKCPKCVYGGKKVVLGAI